MFRLDMHILKKTHTHARTHSRMYTHYERELYTTGIRKKREERKKSQRINVSVVTQNITDEVKLQVQ